MYLDLSFFSMCASVAATDLLSVSYFGPMYCLGGQRRLEFEGEHARESGCCNYGERTQHKSKV